MKKNKISRVLTALLAAACVVGTVNGALAARSTLAAPNGVTLVESGTQRSFVLNGDTKDFFLSFENVMPGDTLPARTVTVSSAEANTQDYRIFLYARKCVTEDAEHVRVDGKDFNPDLLDKLTIEVKSKEGTLGGVEIADNSESNVVEGTALKGVYLGTFKPGDKIDLTVDLRVDIEMGNEFADSAAYIDWVFYADSIPSGGPGPDTSTNPSGSDPSGPNPPPDVDIPDPDVPLIENPPEEEEIIDEGVPMEGMPPQTGDTGAMFLWLGLAVLSGGGMIVLAATGRKKETAAR